MPIQEPLQDNLQKPVCDQAQVLERLFRKTFYESHRTLLQGGVNEPLYLPSDNPATPHRLYYREDYISSALHEIAHWCLAGKLRRRQEDFGYWYLPDGRSDEQQRLFEQVEVKPQALEWMFSVAAGHKFHISIDNLSGEGKASDTFIATVCQQAQCWCEGDIPERGARFIRVLSDNFGTTDVSNPRHYTLASLKVAETEGEVLAG